MAVSALPGSTAIAAESPADQRPAYRGPNLILVRFGGGARRRETIEPEHTYSPFLCHELVPQGTLYPLMEIAQIQGLNTSHGEGTLNIATGHYDQYQDIESRFLGARFEPAVPTLFEYLRKAYAVPDHQTLLINGEDRPDEEFYTFSNHFAFGIDYRCRMLSLYRYKRWLLQRRIAEEGLSPEALQQHQRELAKWERPGAIAPRDGETQSNPELDAFWERWRQTYGESGLVNPRGDRLLTELALRALRELRPRFVMINYQDCDYVHWGYLSHYTRAVAAMDQGLRQIYDAVQADSEYRDNTLVVVVPDCGRDSNPFAHIPCQHHFNSRSAHEIFALLLGPGVSAGTVVDQTVDQTQIAATVGRLMGFPTEHADSRLLEAALA